MPDKRVLASEDEQIEAWVAGESLHFSVHRRIGGEQCCPDFSCCRPELLQPVEVRQAFQRAEPKQRGKFLMAFLGGLVAKARPDVRAYLTDGSAEPSQ